LRPTCHEIVIALSCFLAKEPIREASFPTRAV
jgi:hypothetical protein